jgi:uncharacterized protein
MSSRFLGTGWDFLELTAPPAEGNVAFAVEEESIRQAIWIILSTSPGERVMRPDFGCGIHDQVFAVANSSTVGAVVSAVREALILWEPRIELLDVQAAQDAAAPTRLLVRIDYRVRTTNNQFNLVYPFYLERSAS